MVEAMRNELELGRDTGQENESIQDSGLPKSVVRLHQVFDDANPPLVARPRRP
jgi:hypothetical protein